MPQKRRPARRSPRKSDGAEPRKASASAPAPPAERWVWPLVSAAEMRALDRFTIDELGVPGEVLMESAGRAVCEIVLEEHRERRGRVHIVCGAGNNGGDGLVVARHLHLLGVDVRVAFAQLVEPKRLSGDARLNFERARAIGVPIDESRRRSADGHDVVVDALFGTGLSRPLEGDFAREVERVHAAAARGARIVAVDLPSGLDADTGQILGICVRADRTVTLGLPKRGLALEPGRSLVGRVDVARIGIADRLPESASEGTAAWPAVGLWTPSAAASQLPKRAADGHKGRFGHALVIAGSEGKTGAAALCAIAAGRAGAGLVTLACPASLNDILESKCTEAMTAPVAEHSERALGQNSQAALLQLASERDAVALGPGIGRSDETAKLVHSLAALIERPLVLDADGLFPFATSAETLRSRRWPTVVTPHPGEAAHLLGITAGAVNADRIGAARELAQGLRAVAVLKGAATVIADPGGAVLVNPTGGPELATGGTGDVLTGVVVAFLAAGLAPFFAAAAAVYLHGAAGDRLARERGASGILAGDVGEALPAAARALADAIRTGDPGGAGAGLLVRFPNA